MNQWIRIALAFGREWCFGPGCALCGRPLTGVSEYQYGLCQDCQSEFSLDFVTEPRCSRCGRPLISEKTFCMSCRQKEPPPHEIALALYPYQGRAKKLLEAYKFQRNLQLGWFLAARLLEAAQHLYRLGFAYDAWVPVPPRAGKLKEKGWDQIVTLSQFLAHLGNQRHLPGIPAMPMPAWPVVPCLERLPSQTQKKLHRTERTINLKGKIRCVRKVPQRVILFDDVMTTGATLRSCAEALKQGGAALVGVVALFYD